MAKPSHAKVSIISGSFSQVADTSPTHHGRANDTDRRAKPAGSLRVAPTSAARSPARSIHEAGHEPDADDVRTALAGLIASPPLCKSAQLANFLNFVVEEALAGRGDRIKAYTIATAALGRGETFDPQTDPIVRVEAARLRRALRAYYANGGADDPVVIELPIGTYTPVLRVRQPQHRTALGSLRAAAHELLDYARENRSLLLLIFGIAAAVSVTVELFDILIFDRL